MHTCITILDIKNTFFKKSIIVHFLFSWCLWKLSIIVWQIIYALIITAGRVSSDQGFFTTHTRGKLVWVHLWVQTIMNLPITYLFSVKRRTIKAETGSSRIRTHQLWWILWTSPAASPDWCRRAEPFRDLPAPHTRRAAGTHTARPWG